MTNPGASTRRAGTGGGRLDLLLPAGWPENDADVSWRRRAASGEVTGGRCAFDQIPVNASTIYVWTPTTETLLTQAQLPTRSREKLTQALPFALEEQLLDDPSRLHFAWRRETDGMISVAVTARDSIKGWLSLFQQSGLKPRALAPAVLAVPWSPGSWSAALIEGEMLVRTGPVTGFSCTPGDAEPPAVLLANLREAQQEDRAPEYFILFQPPENLPTDAWQQALGVPLRVEAGSFWDAPGDSQPALNLLQGEFAPRGELGARLRPWLPPAIMLGLLLLVTGVVDFIELQRLESQHKIYLAERNDLMQSAFPDTTTILDPVKQMRTGIEALQARSGMRAGDLLPLLIRATPAWPAQSKVRLQELRYLDRSLTLRVVSPDEAALEQFRQTLQAAGFTVNVLSNSTGDKGFDQQLRLQPPVSAPPTATAGAAS